MIMPGSLSKLHALDLQKWEGIKAALNNKELPLFRQIQHPERTIFWDLYEVGIGGSFPKSSSASSSMSWWERIWGFIFGSQKKNEVQNGKIVFFLEIGTIFAASLEQNYLRWLAKYKGESQFVALSFEEFLELADPPLKDELLFHLDLFA